MSADTPAPEETTLLRALVALQIAERNDRHTQETPRPSEVILADAGLGLPDIATLTGRKYEAVKATIRRAREAKPAKKGRKNA